MPIRIAVGMFLVLLCTGVFLPALLSTNKLPVWVIIMVLSICVGMLVWLVSKLITDY